MQSLHDAARGRSPLVLSTSQQIQLTCGDDTVVIEAVKGVDQLCLRIIEPIDAIIKLRKDNSLSKAKHTIWADKDVKVNRV